MSDPQYIHGYSPKEQERLKVQSSVLSKYIYNRCPFQQGKRILEVGCGVGAQMQYVIPTYQPSYMCGVDISEEQITAAKKNLSDLDPSSYDLLLTDDADYKPAEFFDHLLYVWVLEHVPDPVGLLRSSLQHVKQGGSVFITEVNHGSLKINGASDDFYHVWNASIDYQTQLGGDATIGLRLDPLLAQCKELESFEVKPFAMDFDQNQAEARDEILDFFVDLVESAAIPMIADGVIEESLWTSVKAELKTLIGHPDSSFYYAFVQGFGIKA